MINTRPRSGDDVQTIEARLRLDGLDAAWPLFAAWAREAPTAAQADSAAVASHGE